jgi:hypothetical protein
MASYNNTSDKIDSDFRFFVMFGHGDGCKLGPAVSNLEALECTKTLVALDKKKNKPANDEK